MQATTASRVPGQSRALWISTIAFTSAVAAYGAFFIPKAYGTSISMTGGPSMALWGFMGFYVTCVAITWFFYTRRGGLLRDIERGRPLPPAAVQPAE
jgi:NNP family nitrate/nitrite transporter-like MFS transporter